MTTIREWALKYLDMGFSVVPVIKQSKIPKIGWSEFQKRRMTKKEVLRVFDENDNIAIIAGEISDVTVVDIDNITANSELLDRLLSLDPPRVKTARGLHLYFNYCDKVTNARLHGIQTKIEIKNDGSLVVAPPSVHPNGNRYEWLKEPVLPLPPLPEWFIDNLVADGNGNGKPPVRELHRGVMIGERNVALARLAGSLFRDGLSYDEALSYLLAWNERNTPPLDESEVITTVRSIYKIHMRTTTDELSKIKEEIQYEFVDDVNAMVIAQKLKGKVTYVPGFGWMYYKDKKWVRDSDECIILRLATEALQEHYISLATQTIEHRKKFLEYALKAHKLSHIRAAVELAKSHLLNSHKDFDKDPLLLNCQNGVVDLRSGELLPHSPELKLTKMCNAKYDPDAKRERFEKFLSEVFLNDDQLIDFVQRVLGYAITGDTSEQKLFIAYGTGANGKSTLFRIVKEVLGDYSSAVASDLLIANKKEKNHGLADLFGTRFAIALEIEEDDALAVGLVKQLTGNDVIKARFLYRDYFEFTNQAKIFLLTNHKPRVSDTTPALWRRIVLIPFRAYFPPEKQDARLIEKLLQERDGILVWLIEGAMKWLKEGLKMPDVVEGVVEEYKKENDLLDDWLTDCCELDDNAITSFKELYESYSRYSVENGLTLLSPRAFARRLDEKGFESKKISKGVRARKGLRLREDTITTDTTNTEDDWCENVCMLTPGQGKLCQRRTPCPKRYH